MANDPEAIRAALEPHGYDWSDASIDDYRISVDGERVKWIAEPEGRPAAALAHFLDDKSQTGARIKDLFDNLVSLEEFCCACDMNDPDENIAALWLKVKGLEDPRK